MMRTIAIALPKGGVGKTTTAVNLAACIAAGGHPTLLVDLDTSGAAGLALGIASEDVKIGLWEIFNFVHGLEHAIYPTALPWLHIVPNNAQSPQREDRLFRVAENRSLLKTLLERVSHAYEYVLLDCPPHLRGLTTNALTACSSVVVPVKPGQAEIIAIERLFTYIAWVREVSNPAIAIEGILLTMFEERSRVSGNSITELETKYGPQLFKVRIPKNSALAEASLCGKPAILFNPRARGTQAYAKLAELIIGHSIHTLPPVETENEVANDTMTPG